MQPRAFDWWSDNLGAASPFRTPPKSPSSKLTAGEAIVIGALHDLVMKARYPQNPHDISAALLFDAAKQGALGTLGITEDLARFFLALQKSPEWRASVRRCLYLFRPGSGERTRGCLVYFLGKSPAGNSLGCKPSHTVRVLQYRNTTGEGRYVPQRKSSV